MAFSFFKRDHFILGYERNHILYVKNKDRGGIVFDTLERLGYDPSKKFDEKNNSLLYRSASTKTELFAPMRKNIWKAPLFTMVSAFPLSKEEVIHFYRFCELMGGINITISYVSSVRAFLKNPDITLVHTNYIPEQSAGSQRWLALKDLMLKE